MGVPSGAEGFPRFFFRFFLPLRAALLAGAAALLAACGSTNPYHDPAKPHRGAQGFINPGQAPHATSLWNSFWRRQRGEFKPAREPAGGYEAFAAAWRQPVDGAQLATPPADAPRLIWLGHATTLLQVGGMNVLIDPQLSDFAGPVRWLASPRRVPPPITPEALPKIDLVLITHNHYDHLDVPTLRRLMAAGQTPRFLVPLGLKGWFEDLGIAAVEEMDWWESRNLGPLAVQFLPAHHWSKRSLRDNNQSLWGGWLVKWSPPGRPSWRFMHTGDTAYDGPMYEAIKQRLDGPIDLLALPIGAYEPREFMRPMHTNPDDAVRLMRILDACQAFGIHWGTFELSNEPFDQPPVDLARALKDHDLPADRVWLLRQGEIKLLPSC